MTDRMAGCGRRTSVRTGLPIGKVIGFGWMVMVGPGPAMTPGDGRRIIMAAGTMRDSAGRGGRDRFPGGATGVRRWSDFSGSAVVAGLDSDCDTAAGVLSPLVRE